MTEVAAPVLEMLWENSDPVEVVATRFGHDDAAAASRWVAATVGEHWGVEVDSVTRVVMSGHNALAWISAASGSFLAKWSVLPTKFPRLTALTQLTVWLGERGLPVSVPVPSLDGRVQVATGERTSMSLQHQITGLLLDVTEPQQVRAAGAALAKLHLALAHYPHTEDMGSFTGPPKPLAERITDWLESGRSGALTPAAREQMIGFLAGAPSEELSAQLVHGDFRSSNILCTGQDITAVLDFEEARFDYPIMELAQSAVMLGTRFRDWGPVPPDVHTWLREGYESERPLTTAEAGWWNLLVLWFSFLLVPPGEDPTGWGPAARALLPEMTA